MDEPLGLEWILNTLSRNGEFMGCLCLLGIEWCLDAVPDFSPAELAVLLQFLQTIIPQPKLLSPALQAVQRMCGQVKNQSQQLYPEGIDVWAALYAGLLRLELDWLILYPSVNAQKIYEIECDLAEITHVLELKGFTGEEIVLQERNKCLGSRLTSKGQLIVDILQDPLVLTCSGCKRVEEPQHNSTALQAEASAITETDSGIETSAQSKKDSIPVGTAVAEATNMALENRLDTSDPCRLEEPQHNSTALQAEVSVIAEADSGIETSAQSRIDPTPVGGTVAGATSMRQENKLVSSVPSPCNAWLQLQSGVPDVGLIDYRLPALPGILEKPDMSQEDLLSAPTNPENVIHSEVSTSTKSLELSDDHDMKKLVQFRSFLDQKPDHSFGDLFVISTELGRMRPRPLLSPQATEVYYRLVVQMSGPHLNEAMFVALQIQCLEAIQLWRRDIRGESSPEFEAGSKFLDELYSFLQDSDWNQDQLDESAADQVEYEAKTGIQSEISVNVSAKDLLTSGKLSPVMVGSISAVDIEPGCSQTPGKPSPPSILDSPVLGSPQADTLGGILVGGHQTPGEFGSSLILDLAVPEQVTRLLKPVPAPKIGHSPISEVLETESLGDISHGPQTTDEFSLSLDSAVPEQSTPVLKPVPVLLPSSSPICDRLETEDLEKVAQGPQSPGEIGLPSVPSSSVPKGLSGCPQPQGEFGSSLILDSAVPEQVTCLLKPLPVSKTGPTPNGKGLENESLGDISLRSQKTGELCLSPIPDSRVFKHSSQLHGSLPTSPHNVALINTELETEILGSTPAECFQTPGEFNLPSSLDTPESELLLEVSSIISSTDISQNGLQTSGEFGLPSILDSPVPECFSQILRPLAAASTASSNESFAPSGISANSQSGKLLISSGLSASTLGDLPPTDYPPSATFAHSPNCSDVMTSSFNPGNCRLRRAIGWPQGSPDSSCCVCRILLPRIGVGCLRCITKFRQMVMGSLGESPDQQSAKGRSACL